MTLFCNPSRILNELDEGQTKHWEQSLLKLIELEPGVVFNIMKDPEQRSVRWISKLVFPWPLPRNCNIYREVVLHPDKCISLWLVRRVLLQYIRMLLPEWRSYLPPVLEANLSSLNCCNIALIQCSNIQQKLLSNPTLFYPLVMDLILIVYQYMLPLQQTHH